MSNKKTRIGLHIAIYLTTLSILLLVYIRSYTTGGLATALDAFFALILGFLMVSVMLIYLDKGSIFQAFAVVRKNIITAGTTILTHKNQSSLGKEEITGIVKKTIEEAGREGISSERKEQILKELEEKLESKGEELSQKFDEEVKLAGKQLAEANAKEKKSKEWQIQEILREVFSSRERLLKEVDSLNRKANLNLVIGVFTTIGVMAFLMYAGLSNKQFTGWVEFFSFYLPRITLSIFLELFSFYFLALYKSNLSEIKYYQNEITNIEFKATSLKAALFVEDEKGLDMIVSEFLKIERNRIIKKDETSIELERYKSNNEADKLFVQMLPKIESFKGFFDSKEEEGDKKKGKGKK